MEGTDDCNDPVHRVSLIVCETLNIYHVLFKVSRAGENAYLDRFVYLPSYNPLSQQGVFLFFFLFFKTLFLLCFFVSFSSLYISENKRQIYLLCLRLSLLTFCLL